MSGSQRSLAVFLGLLSLSLIDAAEMRAADTPLIAFSTSPQNQPVTQTIREPKLRYELAIDSLGEAVDEVRVAATPFMDAAGNRIQPKVTLAGDATGAGKKLEALQSLPLVLEAELAQPGTYTSYVSLIYGGKRWTPPLTLNVNFAPQAPEMEVPDALPTGTAALWSRSGKTRVLLDVGVYEKSGQMVGLAFPQLLRIFRKGENAARYATTASCRVLGADRQDLVGPLVLTNRETQQFRFELSDFERAGEYEATLRFTPLGTAPIDRVFSVYVREPLWMASLCIAAGVAISWAVREYLVKTRPRLAVLARMESLILDLEAIGRDGTLTPDLQDTVRSVRSQVTDLRKAVHLEALAITDVETKLGLLEQKGPLLREWVRLPASVHSDEAFKKVGATLRDPDASAEEIKTAKDNVATLAAPKAESLRREAEEESKAARNLARLLRGIRRSDLLVTVVVLAVAVLMGIKALWLSDLSWGGWDDRVVAALWGLGLHQATFTGVEALRTTLAK